MIIRKTRKNAFSLVELLAVMGILAIMAGASTIAMKSLGGSGSTQRAADDLALTLELARAYAMSHNTVVRVAFGKASAGRSTPATVVVVLASVDGSPAAMSTPGQWVRISRPLVLDNFIFDDGLAAGTLPEGVMMPSQTDIGAIGYRLPDVGTIQFDAFLQFSAAGEAAVLAGEPARSIQIGMDRPTPERGRDPFVLRLSGMNGSLITLRKEDNIL